MSDVQGSKQSDQQDPRRNAASPSQVSPIVEAAGGSIHVSAAPEDAHASPDPLITWSVSCEGAELDSGIENLSQLTAKDLNHVH